MPSKNHNQYEFQLEDTTQIKISSNFDSGNIQSAHVISNQQIQLSPAFDLMNEQSSFKICLKTFFHFKINVSEKKILRIRISKMKILKTVYQADEKQEYYICYKKREFKQYARLKNKINIQSINQELQIWFDYQFQKQDQIFFSFSYPYPYHKMTSFINSIHTKLSLHQQIYCYKQILAYSIQGRQIPLLNITNHPTKQRSLDNLNQNKNIINNHIYNQCKKPIIAIICRVHPGESPSSYAIEGLIQFLIDQQDYRSYLLRNFFHFIIIPMLNPDGVFHGMFRMDSLGQNLNRFYNQPQQTKQPAIYALKNLFCEFEKQNRLHMLFDFHAHTNLKGFYMYGNSHNDIIVQTESKVFSRIMAQNCKNFNYNLCNYSQTQMNYKDSNEILTKEGCARVMGLKQFNLIYSYTLQLGFFYTKQSQQINPETNIEIKYQSKCYKDTNTKNQNQNLFTQQNFKQTGRSILISILDLYTLNPYTRLKQKTISRLREAVVRQIYQKDEKFLSVKLFEAKRIRHINQTIQRQIIYPFLQKFNIPKIEQDKKTQSLLKIIKKQQKQIQRNQSQNIRQVLSKNQNHFNKQLIKILKYNQKSRKKESTQLFKLIQARSKEVAHSKSAEKELSKSPQIKYEYSTRIIKQTKIQFNPFPILNRSNLKNFVKHNKNLQDLQKVKKNKINLPLLSSQDHRQQKDRFQLQKSELSASVLMLKQRKNIDIKFIGRTPKLVSEDNFKL